MTWTSKRWQASPCHASVWAGTYAVAHICNGAVVQCQIRCATSQQLGWDDGPVAKLTVQRLLAQTGSVAAEMSKNFSGAEIEGLVNSARSFAFNREVDVRNLSKQIDEDNLKVTLQSCPLSCRPWI